VVKRTDIKGHGANDYTDEEKTALAAGPCAQFGTHGMSFQEFLTCEGRQRPLKRVASECRPHVRSLFFLLARAGWHFALPELIGLVKPAPKS